MALPPNPRTVVTGSGSGLGRAICLRLAQRGARLIVSDINLKGAEETASQTGDSKVHVMACDVSKAEQVEALAAAADKLWGGVDLVVNNAGVAVGGDMGDISLTDWQWIVSVNLWGPIHGCHVFVPRMRKQGSGHILNVASMAGLVYGPFMGPYNATKAAVVALSETLHGELRQANIGVSVLCPYFFETNIARSSRGSNDTFRVMGQRMLEASSLSADDVARLAIEGVERNDLHILPHAQGRWLWRAKRWLPGVFTRLAPRVVESRMRKMMAELESAAHPAASSEPHAPEPAAPARGGPEN